MYNNFPLGFVPPMPMPGYIGFGQGRGGNRARNGQNSNPRVCYFCKENGHFVAACPKIKKGIRCLIMLESYGNLYEKTLFSKFCCLFTSCQRY